MEVIGAGFGRTGTLSLKAALETLGFDPCHHMAEVFKHPAQAKLWHRAVLGKRRGESIDWEGLLGGYQAAVDWPGCHFWEEMMRAFPEAKVLLSVRDPDRWYESAHRTIFQVRRSGFWLLYAIPVVRWIPKMLDAIWEDTFGRDFGDRAHAKRVFERHVQDVREKVPAERLLVYEVGQGWEPLCEYLGVEVPEEPFPHLNDSASSWKLIRAVTVLPYIAFTVAAVSGGAALLRILRRVRSL